MNSSDDLIQLFESALFQSLGKEQAITNYEPVYGGSINQTIKLETTENTYFLKWNNEPETDDLFEKEADGLHQLALGPIKTPQVIGQGKINQTPYLLLEFIHKSAPIGHFWEDFGEKLAQQHQITEAQFGLHTNNHIGKLPQKNDWADSWIDFFINNRLEPQLGLALYNELIDRTFLEKFRSLYPKLQGLLPDEPASLLHGDLWSGNFMIGPAGEVIIFDPAVYYGHREMELAFTQLFGGFDVSFYHTYDETYPLQAGFHERMDIYNLYPLLVHVNLFGRSYLSGITSTLKRFI